MALSCTWRGSDQILAFYFFPTERRVRHWNVAEGGGGVTISGIVQEAFGCGTWGAKFRGDYGGAGLMVGVDKP